MEEETPKGNLILHSRDKLGDWEGGVRDHPLMMSEFRGREGVQEIRTSVTQNSDISTQNSDMGEGGGPKIDKKFGHHLWIVPYQSHRRLS